MPAKPAYNVPAPAHAPKPAPAVIPPAPGKPVEARPRLAEDLGKRIREALVKISEAQATATRNVIDLYYAKITTNAKLISDGDSDFVRKPVFHPVNKERFTLKIPSKANLLIAHLGAAILGMYDVALLQHDDDTMRIAEGIRSYAALAEKRSARVLLLEDIARYGLDKFLLDGTEATGYTLVKPGVKVNATPPPVNPDRKSDDIGDEDFGEDDIDPDVIRDQIHQTDDGE